MLSTFLSLLIFAVLCLISLNECNAVFVVCEYNNVGRGTQCSGPYDSSDPSVYSKEVGVYTRHYKSRLGDNATRSDFCEAHCSNHNECLGFVADPGDGSAVQDRKRVRCWIATKTPTGASNDGRNRIDVCQKKIFDSCRAAPTPNPNPTSMAAPAATATPTVAPINDLHQQAENPNSTRKLPYWFWPVFGFVAFSSTSLLICCCSFRKAYLESKNGGGNGSLSSVQSATTKTTTSDGTMGDGNFTLSSDTLGEQNHGSNGFHSIFTSNMMRGMNTPTFSSHNTTPGGISSCSGGIGGFTSSNNDFGGGGCTSSSNDFGGGCTSSGTDNGCGGDFGTSY